MLKLKVPPPHHDITSTRWQRSHQDSSTSQPKWKRVCGVVFRLFREQAPMLMLIVVASSVLYCQTTVDAGQTDLEVTSLSEYLVLKRSVYVLRRILSRT